MKKFTLSTILFLAMSMLIVSCSKEDDNDDNNNPVNNPCPLNSWLGDYTGTETIDGGTPTPVTFSIETFSTDNDFQIVTTGLTVAAFEPTSCTVMKEFTNPFGKDVYTIVLDGNEVTWTRQEYDSNDVLEETTIRVGTK